MWIAVLKRLPGRRLWRFLVVAWACRPSLDVLNRLSVPWRGYREERRALQRAKRIDGETGRKRDVKIMIRGGLKDFPAD
jgi:hypothetical protein